MRILVTGGAGYIGSHTAKTLHAAGHEPVTFDNLSTGHRGAVRWGPLVVGDLAHPGEITRALREHEIEAVMHFAAYAHVGESLTNPGKYFRNNLTNTLHLLEAMKDRNVRHIVFSSSCATYGVPATLPIAESHPQHPINPYGESKLFVERALHWFGQAYGLRSAILRYFNAAGADPDGEIGENHDPETHLIPSAMAAALGTVPTLDIYGANHPTTDGTAVRDYVHVIDLARAHVLAVDYLVTHDQDLALNLGTGQGHSIREVVHAIERITEKRVPARYVGRRAGDPPILVADATRAREALCWIPELSDLDTVVRSAWTWHSSQQSMHVPTALRG